MAPTWHDLYTSPSDRGLPQITEKITQQGAFVSLHQDFITGYSRWGFGPLEPENPFPNGEGSLHLWQGFEDAIGCDRRFESRFPTNGGFRFWDRERWRHEDRFAVSVVQLPDPLPDHDEVTDKDDQLLHSPLRKQNLILSFTLEEIQFRSGKSFGRIPGQCLEC
ncbi:hypothetical protein MLD38_038056 [Melastoma candidum]|uniref:Uncharacterized protein n=1 Tax=Melastoma candidum TaxID=119954 RepID=A0ACB9KYA8_9MYRT|nr:hypothetical protein MLD38_038056 [Melastoma candidum]